MIYNFNFALHFIFYVQMYSNYFQYDIFVKFLARIFLPVLYLIPLKAPPLKNSLMSSMYEASQGLFI